MAKNPRQTQWSYWFVGAMVVGCAMALWRGYLAGPFDGSLARAAETPRRSAVLPAVGGEDRIPSPIRLTADLLKEPAEAVKKGVDRLTQAVTPTPAIEPAEDPTSLHTKPRVRPELYIAAAQVHESAGRLAQAENAFQQAFRLAPRYLPTHLAYARFKDRQHHSAEALEIYLRLAREYPNEATVFNDLGLYYARRGMNEEAIAAFERAVQLQPKRQLYRNNLAVVLVQSDALDAAMGHLLAVYTEAEACYKLGYLLQKKGDTELALEYFGRALQLNPGMIQARRWHEHLRRVLAGRNEPARTVPGELGSPPLPPAGQGEPRTAQRLGGLPEDNAISPSGGQRPSAVPPPAGGPSATRAPSSGPGEAGPPPVRPLPPVPRRLPSVDREASPSEDSLPPMPPADGSGLPGPTSQQGQSPPKAELPDAPLPPVSRAVRLPSVSHGELRPVPPVGP